MGKDKWGLSELGYSMAWYAVVLGFVLAPLMSLAVDISRLLFVRSDLQTSVDAACEAAALAADVPHFMATGEQRIDPAAAAASASQAFIASAAEAAAIQYDPHLVGVSLLSPTEVACAAEAAVVPLIPFSPDLRVQVSAQARMRFVAGGP
jgi:hypothetical protein